MPEGIVKMPLAVITLWVGMLFNLVCAFVLQGLLTRFLGPIAYGEWAAAFALVSLFSPLASFGLAGFILRLHGESPKALFTRLPVLGIIFCVTASSAFFLAALIFAGNTEYFLPAHLGLKLASVVISLAILDIVSAILLIREKILVAAIWQVLPNFSRVVVIILLSYFDNLLTPESLYYVVQGFFVVGLLVVAFAAWVCYDFFRWLESEAFNGTFSGGFDRRITDSLRRSLPFMLAGLFYLIFYQSNILVINAFKGSESAGIYSLAFYFMAAVYSLPTVVYQRILPRFHTIAFHDADNLYDVSHRTTRVMFVLGVIAMLGVQVISGPLTTFIAGELFAKSSEILKLLAICFPFRFAAVGLGAALSTGDRIYLKVRLMACVAALNLVLVFPLVFLWGLVGAAVAAVVSEAVLFWLYRGSVRDSLRQGYLKSY